MSSVSIVIPAYKPDFLEPALESALAQTRPADEILVSDNCPDDAVQRLVGRYPGIRYRRNPVRGVYANFRHCIRIARGEFVKFLLDDDRLETHCLEVMLRGFDAYPDATLVAGWYRMIDEEERELEIRRLAERLLVSSPGGAAPHMLISARNPIGPLTTFMFRRRSLPLGLGPWFFHTGAPQLYRGLIDMTIILDLAFLGRVVVFPEPLSAMRSHEKQLSNPQINPNGIHTVTSWDPLVRDAHAFGLITHDQLQKALRSIADQYRRFLRVYPELSERLKLLEQELSAS